MAYASRCSAKDPWTGPYPSKAGEFCGNTHRDQLEIHPERMRNKRVGRASACKAGTSEEMRVNGYVGLYLFADSPNTIGETREVDTDALHEEVVSGRRPSQRPYVAPE